VDADLFDAGFKARGHEMGQILRAGEENEDQLDGIGDPLLGFEAGGQSLEW